VEGDSMIGKVADSVQPFLIALSRMPLRRFKRKVQIAQMGWIVAKIKIKQMRPGVI
jgi:hypothetical protein